MHKVSKRKLQLVALCRGIDSNTDVQLSHLSHIACVRMLLYLVYTLLLPQKFKSIMMSGEQINGTLRALGKSFDLLEFLLAISFLLLSLNEMFTIVSNTTLTTK